MNQRNKEQQYIDYIFQSIHTLIIHQRHLHTTIHPTRKRRLRLRTRRVLDSEIHSYITKYKRYYSDYAKQHGMPVDILEYSVRVSNISPLNVLHEPLWGQYAFTARSPTLFGMLL